MDLPRSLVAVRLLLTGILFLVFLYTCYKSIQKLREGAITKTTTSIKIPAIFPALTLCNDKYEDNPILANMSFSEAMSKIPERDDLIVKFFYFSKLFKNATTSLPEDNWRKHVYFVNAFVDNALNIWTCYTVNINEKAMPMDEVMYYLRRNSSGLWFKVDKYSIIIHEKDQFILNDFDVGGMKSVRTFKDERSLSTGHTFQVGMSLNTVLNTATSPCDEENKQLLTQCIEDFLVKEIGCRMPWMRNSGNFPDCNSMDDIFRLADMNFQIRIRIFEQIVNFTGCRPNCRHYSYNANFITNFDDNQYAVALIIVQEDTPATVEAYMYQYDDFLADFGGYLGLLVGGSALSLVEYLLYSVHFVGKKISVTRKKKRKMTK